jgi:type I restriction enzyme S subunit
MTAGLRSAHGMARYYVVVTEKGAKGVGNRVEGSIRGDERIPVVIPTKSVVEAFANWAAPLTAKARFARAESRTLAELRDILLPKLISGEIRIRDAEELAEAVL